MQNRSDIHMLIEGSPLFRSMQEQETEAILARLAPVQVPWGTHIIERAAWHGKLYIIVSGEVSVLLQDDGYEVARLGRGECFGEMSLITGELPSATIRAEQEVNLLSLSQTDFLALIGICPTLMKNINTILSQRLARANQQLVSTHAAEILLLAQNDTVALPYERLLGLHIADALVRRTQKRVLLLELCAEESAASRHFLPNSQQWRPSLLDCVENPQLLHQHHAALTIAGQQAAAGAALASTREQAEQVDERSLPILAELATLYDYLLLVVTAHTPGHVIASLIESQEAKRAYILRRRITLLAADAVEKNSVAPPSGPVFVTDVHTTPTMGLQEHYTTLLGCEVTRLLPADDALLQQCWRQQKTVTAYDAAAPVSKAIDFVARSIAHQTVGIAFGGGGARGFAHLGVLDRLLAHNIPLDYIAACSSGIITPGMYLIGKTIAESEEIFMQIQRHIVQWRIPRTSIFSNRGLKQMLRELCGEQRFEDLTMPFAMVAVDLSTRSGVVLDHGPLWQAGLASVALPGIFPPVIIGQHILMDAGMHDPVPIRLVHKMGADILLASELGEQEPLTLQSATPWQQEVEKRHQGQVATPHIVDLLLRTYDLAMATIGMHSIREADVVIRPKLHRVSLRQFSEGRKFVTAGRDAVELALPALQKRLPWIQ